MVNVKNGQLSRVRLSTFAVGASEASGLMAFCTGFIRVVVKIRGTILGVPIIRTIKCWGLYWGTLI